MYERPEELPEPYATIAEGIGIEHALWIAKNFGGEQVYMPKYEAVERPLRNCKIREEFNGYNFKSLAKKYGLTEMGIRQIVSENIISERAKPNVNQISFFDTE